MFPFSSIRLQNRADPFFLLSYLSLIRLGERRHSQYPRNNLTFLGKDKINKIIFVKTRHFYPDGYNI